MTRTITRRSSRLAAAGAVTLVGALLLSGCGRSGSPTGGDGGGGEAIDDSPATGTVEVWAMGNEGEVLDELAAKFEEENDDYKAIMVKALADRLAEAFAERMHQRVRKELWGYAADEKLENDALIREEYSGIRPAPGYPACPEHTEKRTLWKLLEVEENAGITLTESCAMMPGAAVSGYYFSHPESTYFGVSDIGRDQVQDYAERKGWSLREAEKWLAPNLAYDPE